MIRLLIGIARSGKTHAVYSELKSAIEAGFSNELLLIVPEQFTLEAEKQLIAHIGGAGILGVEVLSFKRLAHRVFQELGLMERVQINDIGKLMLLRRLFDRHQKQLKLYQSSADKAGFLMRIHDLIKEMKQSMITPETLTNLLEVIEKDTLIKLKLEDLKLIYEAYEAEKSNQYFDEEDYYTFMLEIMKESTKLANTQIWIDGFDSFTIQEYAIIEVLTTISKVLTVTVASDGLSQEGVFSHTQNMIFKLYEMGKTNQNEIKALKLDRPFDNSTLEHLSKNLLSYPYQKRQLKDDSLMIFAGNNRLSEVEYCAVQIINCIRNESYTWKDIAVVTNDLSAYEMAIKRIFNEYKLPYFLDIKVSMMSNPLIHFILSSCKILSDNFNVQHILRFLKTGFFEYSLEDISAFEHYITQYGIREKHFFVEFEKEAPLGCSLEVINQVRSRFCDAISPLRELFKSNKPTVKMFIENLFAMMLKLNVQKTIQIKMDAFTRDHQFNEAQQFAQIWNKVINLFDQLVELIGMEKLDIEEITDLLEIGLETLEVGMLPLNENQLLIGSLDRSRAHPIKVLFMLGINDGILPESGNDQQLILDAEKEIIKEKGFYFLSDSKMFADKEIFNIYTAITRPSDRLYFSYAKSDAEGSALRPSYLVGKLQKMFPNMRIVNESANADKFPLFIATKEGTVKHMAYEMRRSADGYKTEQLWKDVYSWYVEHDFDRAKKLYEGLSHNNLVGKLSGKSIENLYEMPLRTSVSKLEQFVQCPFKYFVESGLNPIDIKTYSISYPDVGILFHKALELFGKHIFELNLDWMKITQDESEIIMDAIVSEMVDSDIYRSKFKYQYMVNKLKRVAKRAAWVLTQHLQSGHFIPTAFEVAFSENMQSAPPIIIKLKNGEKLIIRGVIDRIDMLNFDGTSYIKIIDYKSGKKSLTLSDIYNGLQMQLLVYLDACIGNPQYFGVSEILPAGAFYFKIDDPLIETTEQVRDLVEARVASELKLDGIVLDDVIVLKGMDEVLYDQKKSDIIQVKIKADGSFSNDSKILPLDGFYQMIDHVKDTISQIGDDLYKGVIDILPCKGDHFTSCDYCEYQALCQFDQKFKNNTYRRVKTLSNDEISKALIK